MSKKNGFVMFMEARRPQLLADGHDLTGGFRDLVVICGNEWLVLPEDEKQKYIAEAKLWNERAKDEKTAGQLSSQGQLGNVPVTGTSTVRKQLETTIYPYRFTEEDYFIFQANQEIVKMFERKEWMSQPIVICSFTMYLEPDLHTLFLPAEVGLTAMTLKDGVIDNYSRIIEPGPIPKGHGIEAIQNAEKLGLPEIGQIRELADLQSLMMIIESFLITYKGSLKGRQLYVFAFDSDFVMVSRCFEWLIKTSDAKFSVTVLSLNLYACMASTISNPNDASGLNSICQGMKALMNPPQGRKLGSMDSPVYREPGKPLAGNFIYAANHSRDFAGVFLSKEDVEKCVKDVDNYKYYEELCCAYHMLSGKEVHKCALNISNRYAFSILEYLTLRYQLPIIRGGHYPEIDKPAVEKKRRVNMISRWGLTQMEENMITEEEDKIAKEKMDVEKKLEAGVHVAVPATSGGTQARGRSRRRDEESHQREKRQKRRDRSGNCYSHFNEAKNVPRDEGAVGGAGPSEPGIPRNLFAIRNQSRGSGGPQHVAGNMGRDREPKKRDVPGNLTDSRIDSNPGFDVGGSTEWIRVKSLGDSHVPKEHQGKNPIPNFRPIPVFFHFDV